MSILRIITTYSDFFHIGTGDILVDRISALSSAVKSSTYFGSNYLENMKLGRDANIAT